MSELDMAFNSDLTIGADKTNQTKQKTTPHHLLSHMSFLGQWSEVACPLTRQLQSINFQLSDQKKRLLFIMLDLFHARRGPFLLKPYP